MFFPLRTTTLKGLVPHLLGNTLTITTHHLLAVGEAVGNALLLVLLALVTRIISVVDGCAADGAAAHAGVGVVLALAAVG